MLRKHKSTKRQFLLSSYITLSILILTGSGQYHIGSTLNDYHLEDYLIDFSFSLQDNLTTESNNDSGKKQKNIDSLCCNTRHPHRKSHIFNIALITTCSFLEYNYSDHSPRDPPLL